MAPRKEMYFPQNMKKVSGMKKVRAIKPARQ